MITMSDLLIRQAIITAKELIDSGDDISEIASTGFFLLSIEADAPGYTAWQSLEVDGRNFLIAWQKSR